MAVEFVSRRPAGGFFSSAALRGKNAAITENVITSSWDVFIGLTRHKISDREPGKARYAAEAWMANTQHVSRSLARGSLHRLVRSIWACLHEWHLNEPYKSRRESPRRRHLDTYTANRMQLEHLYGQLYEGDRRQDDQQE